MIRPLRVLLIGLLSVLLVAGSSVALAQEAPKPSPLGVPQATGAQNSPRASSPTPGVLGQAWMWLIAQQEEMRRGLAGSVRALKTGESFTPLFALMFLSFTYGVLHAAGPGHGKAVISSYVLANERTMRRGVLLSFLSALFQALSAILIIGILLAIFQALGLALKTQLSKTEAWIETVSWALVAAIGGWMLVSRVWPLVAGGRTTAAAQSHDHTHHGHHHHPQGHDHAQHHHRHAADAPCPTCGHAHIPAADTLEGTWSWKKAFAIALAVGIRPCTGAIFVLIVTIGQGLWWAGVLSTFAMAIGTAITVSALAALAVGSRELATRLAGPGSRWAERIELGVALVGATLVLLMGVVFFVGSLEQLGQQRPF